MMPVTLTRSLLVILIPGGVAAAPWLVLVALLSPRLLDYYNEYPLAGNSLAFALFVVVGSVMEGINTFFETRWDGRLQEKLEVRENWYAYLARVCSAEPVGFRYISRLATSMYFELSMMWASASFWVGIAAWIAVFDAGCVCWSVAAVLVAAASVAYFHWQARTSHRVLCETRAEILKRMGQ